MRAGRAAFSMSMLGCCCGIVWRAPARQGTPNRLLAPAFATLATRPRRAGTRESVPGGRQGRGRRRHAPLMSVSDQPFRQPAPEEPKAPKTFKQLGLLNELVDATEDMGFEAPSAVQSLAIPQLLSGGNVVFAAATGSGKTIAYLMPVVQQLKAAELVADAATVRKTQRPRALVLVPTRELASQVLDVAKKLAHHAKFSSCAIMGGEDYGKQKKALAGTVDLVVASPGRLLKHRDQGHFFMSQVSHVVIDEVDTMFTQGFGPDIKKLLLPLIAKPERRDSAQFVFVTATLTKAVRRMLEEGDYPKVRMVETRDVHKSLPSMNHVMIDLKGRDKISALIDVLRQYSQFERTLVFCNTVKSCRAAEHGMREADIVAECYHGEVPSGERAKNLEDFKQGKLRHLVATDIAARGLDMPNVDHVVMFDFPLNAIDYLHRSGRTARMGAKGRVTSLLAKRDVVLGAAIEQSVLAGQPLDELSSRKTDYETGGKLAPVFGRPGKPANKGNRHALKPVVNIRARGKLTDSARAGVRKKDQSRGRGTGGAGRGSGVRTGFRGRGGGGDDILLQQCYYAELRKGHC